MRNVSTTVWGGALGVLLMMVAAAPRPVAARSPNTTPDAPTTPTVVGVNEAVELDLTLEVLGGVASPSGGIPTDVEEGEVYPVQVESLRELMDAIPGEPFRQVSPTPHRRAWWLYPIYPVVGLPRDLVDSVFGGLSYVPFVNLVVLTGYEVVPTQVFVRHWGDWHRWPGRRNKNQHGMIDSANWGFFPSLNSWHWSYPSQKQLLRNRAYNEQLYAELRERNRAIKHGNDDVRRRRNDVKHQARAAILAGRGREALCRALPYHRAYPKDVRGGSLLVAALALYAPDGPEWCRPEMWHAIQALQPLQLEDLEDVLTEAVDAQPAHGGLSEALIHTQMLRGRREAALDTAVVALKKAPRDRRRQRLVFETALAAHDAEAAQFVWAALAAADAPTPAHRALVRAFSTTGSQARLALIAGETDAARRTLEPLSAAFPEDAWLNYYLGLADLIDFESGHGDAETFDRGFSLLERASLQAPTPALRMRAGKALVRAREALDDRMDAVGAQRKKARRADDDDKDRDLGLFDAFGL